MIFILLILSLLSLSFCQYQKLSKYSYVNVDPNTKVYLDLSSFKIGDTISLEIKMSFAFTINPNFFSHTPTQNSSTLHQ